MMKPVKRFLKRQRKARRVGRSVIPDFFAHARTVKNKTCIDDRGLPVPWMTYPAICYLKQLDFSASSVFEYGSGYSTQFWSARAKRVVSVEYDEGWAEKVCALSLPNVELIHARDAAYVTASELHAPHDVIIIDGHWRYDCAMACLRTLSPQGMVILDNSERYPAITEHFRSEGLLQIDFIGFGPMNLAMWATSIFLSRATQLKPLHAEQPRHLAGMTDSIERNPRHAALNCPGSF